MNHKLFQDVHRKALVNNFVCFFHRFAYDRLQTLVVCFFSFLLRACREVKLRNCLYENVSTISTGKVFLVFFGTPSVEYTSEYIRRHLDLSTGVNCIAIVREISFRIFFSLIPLYQVVELFTFL